MGGARPGKGHLREFVRRLLSSRDSDVLSVDVRLRLSLARISVATGGTGVYHMRMLWLNDDNDESIYQFVEGELASLVKTDVHSLHRAKSTLFRFCEKLPMGKRKADATDMIFSFPEIFFVSDSFSPGSDMVSKRNLRGHHKSYVECKSS